MDDDGLDRRFRYAPRDAMRPTQEIEARATLAAARWVARAVNASGMRWAIALVLSSAAVNAESPGTPFPVPRLGDPAWQVVHFPKIARHTHYEVVDAPDAVGRRAVRSRAECSASGLMVSLEGADLAAGPRLSWRWRVLEPLANKGERTKSGDDFAARVYVMFTFEPAHATLWQRATRRAATLLFGERTPGVALDFVWASREPVGADWPSPYTEEVHVVVLQTGAAPSSDWVREEVDLKAEFQHAFGREAPPPSGLALMTDSDGVCAVASAEFADFELLRASEIGIAAPEVQ
jgi:hypothetical protein